MKKFKVSIARTETTVYYFDVEAEHEGIAEEIATERYNEENYDSKNVVWAEEFTHDIDEVTNEKIRS
jgi:hypothetical protein